MAYGDGAACWPCYKHSEQMYYSMVRPKTQVQGGAIFAPVFRKVMYMLEKYNAAVYREKYPISVEILHKAYIDEGKTLKEMCNIIGVTSPITVSKILKAYGFDTNKNSKATNQTKNGRTDKEFKQLLIEEYVKNRRSIDSIAQELSVSNRTILNYLKRYGISRRSRNEKSSCFTGGRNICSNGYVEIIVPGHPATNARGYVYEHRIVAEKKLGRYLRSDEVVHHIDGNKTNNSPDNLIVLSNEDHATLHALLKSGMSYEDAIREVLL